MCAWFMEPGLHLPSSVALPFEWFKPQSIVTPSLNIRVSGTRWQGWGITDYIQSVADGASTPALLFGVLGWVSVQHFETSADVRRAI